MSKAPQDWLTNGKERLQAATLLLEHDLSSDALTRIYFGVFQATKAALAARGIRPGTHRGVTRMLGREFRGRLDTTLFDTLRQERDACDYELVSFSTEHVEKRLSAADKYVDNVQALMHASL